MKNAIKTAVADLFPVLLAQPLESDFTPGERAVDADGGSSSLARKLRSMSTESFVQLLAAIFSIVLAHLIRADEVKNAIEWIMCNIDGSYAADSVGAVAAEAQETDSQGNPFMKYSPQRNAARMPSLNDSLSPSNISKNFRADVLRENTEAVFAACDAAHGRWAKLLGVRTFLHPRLRLLDFLNIYNIRQKFITATVKIGGRLGYSIRGTLQSQAKAVVDFQHESHLAKIKAVLDQETWVEVDVPDVYQAILTSLFCSEPLTTGNVNDGQDNAGQVISLSKVLPNYNNNSDVVTTAAQSSSTNNEERGRASLQTLSIRGVDYHMVN